MHEYMDDINGVGEIMRRSKDESSTVYYSCKQQYTRLYTEMEQITRKAYNMVEAAESMLRTAEAEFDLAMRLMENAEDENAQETARRQLQHAQEIRAEAEAEMAVASAEYSKAQAKMKYLTDVWDKYQSQLELASHKVEEGISAFVTVVGNGNRDLGEYMNVMDKAQASLYEGNPAAQSAYIGSGSAQTLSVESGMSASPRGSSILETSAGNTVGLATVAGMNTIMMSIAGKDYSFPNSKSGAAKAYRVALKSGDQEMIAKTGAIFKTAAPMAYAGDHSSKHTKYVTIPYETTLPNGEIETHTYDLPIIYDDSVSDIPQGTVSFGTDSKAAAEWAHSSFSDWRDNLSKSSVDAILTYSSTMEYETINRANRGSIPMSKGLEALTDSIDAGINASSLPQVTIVYRAVSEAAVVDMALKAGGRLESGIVLEDQGFLSASLVSDTIFARENDYIMRLTAVPGLHGAPLEYGDLSQIPRESEILFGRNHNIYVRNVVEAQRCDVIPNSNEDRITIIDGVLTI